jgi:hypothetical protein
MTRGGDALGSPAVAYFQFTTVLNNPRRASQCTIMFK